MNFDEIALIVRVMTEYVEKCVEKSTEAHDKADRLNASASDEYERDKADREYWAARNALDSFVNGWRK